MKDHGMPLRDRIDVFCAMLGMWGGPILDYFEDAEAAGLADYSEWLEFLEAGDPSEVLAAPLLALGLFGSGRLLWAAGRKVRRRLPSR
jgi:hypothetical protein